MTRSILDDESAWKPLDPGDMTGSVRGLPEQCEEAWEAAQSLHVPADYANIERIVVLGMGGSAIAGDIWRVLLQRESPVPVFNVRQYDLPSFVDGRTLVIASSFSGNTEETLSAFQQALATPAKKLVITAGGKLLTLARANGIPLFTYEYAGEPRSALGWSLMPLLAISARLGLMQGIGEEIKEAAAVMQAMRERIGEGAPSAVNPAKQLAQRLHGRLPVIYGAGPLAEVAHRWKTQLNESGKVWCFYEELPELHHNAIIGYRLPEAIAKSITVVFLRSADLIHPRVLLRYDFTQRLLAEAGVDSAGVVSEGKGALAQMMSLIYFGDYVSAYLAFLYGVDPTPTTVIDELKAWLAQQK